MLKVVKRAYKLIPGKNRNVGNVLEKVFDHHKECKVLTIVPPSVTIKKFRKIGSRVINFKIMNMNPINDQFL